MPDDLPDKTAADVLWTDELVEQLKALWTAGASARECVEALGCGTRSAIIGKVSRLGLPRRVRPLSTSTRRRRARPRRPDYVREIVEPSGAQPAFGPCSIYELTQHTCRWPIGTPGTPEFYFCGEEPKPSKIYCAAHCQLAFH